MKKERKRKKERRERERGPGREIKEEEEEVLMQPRFITYQGKQRRIAKKSKRYTRNPNFGKS